MAQPQVPWTNGGPLLPDSSNFVTASLLIASPGNPIYSQLGHAAIRMECPVHNLDFCFSFEDDTRLIDFVKFFSGNSNARIIAIETTPFINGYKTQGREIIQYQLNLKLHEKQLLWKILDESSLDDNDVKFNFLQNNCSSILLEFLESALIEETISYNWGEQMNLTNGEHLRKLTQNSPWFEFIGITLLGTEADAIWGPKQRISPKTLVEELKRAIIVSKDGAIRPFISDGQVLVPMTDSNPESPLSPKLVFGILFIITFVITILELLHIKTTHIFGCIIDVLLLVFQFITGVVLLYMSAFSGIFGLHWNWYLVVFNPIPLLIWIFFHKKPDFYKIYFVYSVLLILFILATPLSEQLDLPHQLVTSAFALRCIYNYFIKRISK